MFRALGFAAAIVAALVSQANAIEMFTNFHNGENLGFPPMEVPASIYGGFGHGGWNPHAAGTPFRSINPVPSMSPTGQIPGRPCMIRGPINEGSAVENVQPSNANHQADSSQWQYEGPAPQYVSDRRHGRWQHVNSGETAQANNSDSTAQPRLAPKSDESGEANGSQEIDNSSRQSPAANRASVRTNKLSPAPVNILHGEPGTAPTWDQSSSNQQSATGFESSQSPKHLNSTQTDSFTNRSGNNDDDEKASWTKGDAMFPRNDAG